MSKSKGNVVTPMALLEEHGSDGVRYWAASGRPGTDTVFDPGQMKVGRRLAMKLLNASRFALTQTDPRGPITVPVDRAMLTSLARLVSDCTAQFDDCQYATVLERTERWFWSFCDDYLELVKSRRYGAQGPEARRLGQHRAAGQPLGPAAAVCAVSAVRHRRGVVVVAERVRSSCALASRRPSSSS